MTSKHQNNHLNLDLPRDRHEVNRNSLSLTYLMWMALRRLGRYHATQWTAGGWAMVGGRGKLRMKKNVVRECPEYLLHFIAIPKENYFPYTHYLVKAELMDYTGFY